MGECGMNVICVIRWARASARRERKIGNELGWNEGGQCEFMDSRT